jgi:hypothetical protein
VGVDGEYGSVVSRVERRVGEIAENLAQVKNKFGRLNHEDREHLIARRHPEPRSGPSAPPELAGAAKG